MAYVLQGIGKSDRTLLWPFLLGVFTPDSTYDDRSAERQRLQNIFARLVFVCEEINTAIEGIKQGLGGHGMNDGARNLTKGIPDKSLFEPFGQDTWPHGRNVSDSGSEFTTVGVKRIVGTSSSDSSPEKGQRLKGYSPRLTGSHASFAEAHRVIVMDAVRTDMKPIHQMLLKSTNRAKSVQTAQSQLMGMDGLIPNSNVLPVSGCECMPELMFVEPPELNPSQAIASGKQPLWKSSIATQMIDGSEHLSNMDKRLMVRLVNILSAYAVHDPETGYCQGMSDLAVVFIGLEDDDALAFACFEKFMRAARQNFRHDETGIKDQLKEVSGIVENTDPKLFLKISSLGDKICMFAYRMVVVLMRRELPLADVLTLWEISWAHSVGEHEATTKSSSSNARTISLKGIDKQLSKSKLLDSTLQSLDRLMESWPQEGVGCITSGRERCRKHGEACKCSAFNASKSPGFFLQFVAAVIKSQRQAIMNECEKPDDLMRLFNRPCIDFWTTVVSARKQVKAYKQGLQVMQSLLS